MSSVLAIALAGNVLAEILGPDGLIVLAVVLVLLLFGGAQLPKLARGLGSAGHEFRKGLGEGDAISPNPLAAPNVPDASHDRAEP